MAEGIEKRTSRGYPVYRAIVRDRRTGRRVSRTFPTLAQARSWRTRMQDLARRGFSLAGTPETVREVAEAFIEGLKSGAIRTRQGVAYKPSVIRAYESSLRNHVLPDLGGKKLAKLERRDVQALVERLTEKVGPSAVRNAVKPLQTICRRAVEDGDLAISPCEHLRLPAAPDRRERIASPAEAASLIAALEPARPRALGLRLLRRAEDGGDPGAPLGRRRPRRRRDPRRAGDGQQRRPDHAEVPRRPPARPDRPAAAGRARPPPARHQPRPRPRLRHDAGQRRSRRAPSTGARRTPGATQA